MKNSTQNKLHILPVTLLSILFLGTLALTTELTQQQNLQSRAAVSNCDVAATDLSMTVSEQKLLDLINDYRKQNGAGALGFNPDLKRSAEWLSKHMGTGGPFDHTDGLGRSYDVRIADCGFTGKTTSENIAYNTDDDSAAKTFDQWKNSAGHNANMLNASYGQVGIAEFIATDGKHYWTYDAAAGAGVPITRTPQPTVAPTKVPPAPTKAPPAPTAVVATAVPTQAGGGLSPTPIGGTGGITPVENATPTFSCLGSCPTDALGQTPTDIPSEGSLTPTTAPLSGIGQSTPGGQTTNQGLIMLLILLIVQLIQSIFGGA